MSQPCRVVLVTLLLGGAPGLAAQGPPATDIWLLRWPPRVADARNLTARPGYDNQPSFTPDGATILYTSYREGQSDIYRVDVETGAISQVTRTPESEYSPRVMPDGTAFSVVRVEADSTQRLWAFTLDGTIPVLVLPDVRPVGYHAWADGNSVVLFVLGSPPTLHVADTRTGASEVVASRIGRSLQKVPGRRAVSFVDQSDSTRWVIRTLDLDTKAIEEVAPARPGREDFIWRPTGTIVTADGPLLLEWNAGRRRWEERADLSPLGITTITRLAGSPDGAWIAVVAGEKQDG